MDVYEEYHSQLLKSEEWQILNKANQALKKSQTIIKVNAIVIKWILMELDRRRIADKENELVQAAVELVREKQRASVPLLQRYLRLGYPTAVRLIEKLEAAGIIGSRQEDGSRQVLIPSEGKDNEELLDETPSPNLSRGERNKTMENLK